MTIVSIGVHMLELMKRSRVVFVFLTLAAIGSQAQTLTTLWNFNVPNGAQPEAALVQGADGLLYGTTVYGNSSNLGTIFAMTTAGAFTKLYDFQGNDTSPTVLLGSNGNFYGTNYAGELSVYGSIFEITPRGKETTLVNFNNTDGNSPRGPLTEASDGNYYGTTQAGGAADEGTIFRMAPNGTLTTLYSFTNLGDGAGPNGVLFQATDGNLYGGTSQYYGGVFKFTPSGALTTLYTFCAQPNCTDGAALRGLIQANDGNFYGVTTNGGKFCRYLVGCGTVFKLTPAGKLTTIYSFCAQSNCTDGMFPAGLIQATDGNFYGTTSGGGANLPNCPGLLTTCGTVFKMTPSGQLTTLYTFVGPDGAGPQAALLQSTDGNFYGTTAWGGTYNSGTAFRISIGLAPFVQLQITSGKVGQMRVILGQGFTGASGVSFNGVPASFTVHSDTALIAKVPSGATTGLVTVTTPGGTLTSNVAFQVIP